MQVHHVTNVAELQAAYAAAADGDRIELDGNGTFGRVNLGGRDFATGLTITSADPNNRAVLTDMFDLNNSDNVTITGIDFQAGQLAKNSYMHWMQVGNCDGLVISDMNIAGYVPNATEGKDPTDINTNTFDVIAGFGHARGLQIKNSDNVTVSNVDISDLRGSIVLGGVTNAQLDNLDIHDVREGINVFDIRNVVIEDSYFHDFKPWKTDHPQGDDHPDMIQYWAKNSSFGVHDLTIRNNLFHQTEDLLHTQTIQGAMAGAAPGVTATNFTVTGNIIINGHFNGITLKQVDGVTISDNLLLPNQLDVAYTQMIETPGIAVVQSTNVDILNNTFVPVNYTNYVKGVDSTLNGGDVVVSGNTFLNRSASDPNFWQNYLPDLTSWGTSAGTGTAGTGGSTGGGTGGTGGTGGSTGGGTPDPIVATLDLTGMSAADQTDINDPNADIRTGTNAGETLTAGAGGSFLFAFDGDDTLKEKAGNDVMQGGAGGDQFVIDMRSTGGAQTRDLILDLDFTTGDELKVITSVAGTFTDTADPNNRMTIFNNGESIFIRDLVDLAEVVASGAADAATASDGDGLSLYFAVDPGREIELAGYTLADIGLTGPTTGGGSGSGSGSGGGSSPGPTVDPVLNGLDLSGLSTADLTALADPAATIKLGTAAGETLNAGSTDAFLFAFDGADTLKEGTGSDIMHGGAGDDQFVIDLRSPGSAPTRDLIADLIFADGDEIKVVTSVAGTFTDTTDPNNRMTIFNNGQSVFIRDLMDIAEIVNSGAATASDAADGDGLVLVFGVDTTSTVELAGYSLTDLG